MYEGVSVPCGAQGETMRYPGGFIYDSEKEPTKIRDSSTGFPSLGRDTRTESNRQTVMEKIWLTTEPKHSSAERTGPKTNSRSQKKPHNPKAFAEQDTASTQQSPFENVPETIQCWLQLSH